MLFRTKRKLNEIENRLNMTFEEYVNSVLKKAEIDSYNPYESKTKEELQIEYFENIVKNFYNEKKYLIKEAKKLQSILDEAQGLQHELNMIREAEIIETTRSVINKQTRKNYLDIEKCQGRHPENIDIYVIEIFNLDNKDEIKNLIILYNDNW